MGLFSNEKLVASLFWPTLSCIKQLLASEALRSETLRETIYDSHCMQSGIKTWSVLVKRHLPNNSALNSSTLRTNSVSFNEAYSYLLSHSKEARNSILSMEFSM